jgi:hypothetical protein
MATPPHLFREYFSVILVVIIDPQGKFARKNVWPWQTKNVIWKACTAIVWRYCTYMYGFQLNYRSMKSLDYVLIISLYKFPISFFLLFWLQWNLIFAIKCPPYILYNLGRVVMLGRKVVSIHIILPICIQSEYSQYENSFNTEKKLKFLRD